MLASPLVILTPDIGKGDVRGVHNVMSEIDLAVGKIRALDPGPNSGAKFAAF